MRSHYDEYGATSETNKILMMNTTSSNNNNHNNINNNNNGYSSNGAIPYHARENSLPFSYGQISKTSTPLRPTATTNARAASPLTLQQLSSSSSVSRSYKNGVEHDLDFDFDFGLSSSGRNGGGLGYGKTSSSSSGGVGGLNGSGGGVGGDQDVNYNFRQQSTRTTTTSADLLNKRREFFGNGENHFDERRNVGGSVDPVGCTQTLRYNKTSGVQPLSADETDASMIKVQPRLTSPLLVRKTLSSNNTNSSNRSPTRNSNSNTIANTYHYSYGNKNSSDNFDKFGVNGNFNSNKNDGYGYAGDTLTKTPARHDFDELLRERREKVFNEYRSTTQELVASPNGSPLPPPRRFVNGTVQLPSTLPPSHKHNGLAGSSGYAPQVPQRGQSQNSKYNFDFQFNLNLDDNDGVGGHNDNRDRRNQTLDRSPMRQQPQYEDEYLRRRNQTLDRYTSTQRQTNSTSFQRLQQDTDTQDDDILRRRNQTLDRSPLRQQTTTNYERQQQQQQLYQTRDIPLASYNVERNYHTSTSATPSSTNAYNKNNYGGRGETVSPNSMMDIYATPYDDQRHGQPLEANTSNSTTTITTLRTKRAEYSPYGNGNLYTSPAQQQQQQQQQQQHQQQHEQHTNIGQITTMTDRETSPIYATSTKKVTNITTAATTASPYRGNTMQPGSSTSMTTLSVTDYPAPSPTAIRPETPAFPVTPRTPFAGGNSNGYNTTPTLARSNGYLQQQQHHQQQTQNAVAEVQNYSTETIYGTNYRPRLNSSLSMANSEPHEVAAHLVKFAKDSSKFWYKPNLSREEAISLLLNAPPGTFVVRDSTTYKNAYGLVLRVSQPPPGTASTGKPDELVRHFLIEPTTRGVRLKGCANEPVFTSLSALVYEHSINQMALPCLLQIPDRDIVTPLIEPTAAQTQLLTQGAACNVLWLFSCDTESLTGEEAIRKAIRQMYAPNTNVAPTEVHFKVSHQGITLTDNTRKKFFRKHYTADIISYCAIDPDHRLWTMQEHGSDNTTIVGALKKTIFAFVARRSASSKDNQCHVFCDLAINQPASAIVSFVNKTLPTEKQRNYVL